jgi:subfamily B ATP-binding cassette protein MsbA
MDRIKDKSKDKTDRLSFMYLVRAYAWPFRKIMLFLIVVTIVSNIITSIQPIALSGVMSIIIGDNKVDIKQEQSVKLLDLNNLGNRVLKFFADYTNNKWKLIIILISIYLFLVITATFLNYCAYAIALNIETKATKLIQSDLLGHMFSLNLGFYNRQRTGDLMSRITVDAYETANGLGPLVRSCFHHTILIIIYSVYLLSTSVILTLGSFLLILTQFGLTELIKRPLAKAATARLDTRADFSNSLHEVFTSIRVVKSFGGEKFEIKKLFKGIDALVKANVKVGLIKQFSEESRSILDSFAIAGIFIIAFHQLMAGAISIQGFVLFVFVGQLLITPINKLAVNVTWIQALVSSYTRINSIIQTKPEIKDGKIIKNDFKQEINIENISFSYGNEMVLKDVSLKIKKGEVVAIVGPSGAGKTTLVDLILRFYDPQQGNIYMDKVNLKEIQYDEYRKIFGVVPQRNTLFNDTVKNNIAYGRQYLSEEEIIKAAEIANAHKFIMELPQGYDTFVGEKGVLLSGGQCQRIAIARAIVFKPEILILDEATSSLDSESEKQVQMAVDKVLENATAIVIAHRLSTILHAHKIVVLNNGCIEAIGNHAELLLKSFTYKLLYDLQFRNIKINGELAYETKQC